MRGYTLEQWGARLADAAPTAGDDDALAVEGQRRRAIQRNRKQHPEASQTSPSRRVVKKRVAGRIEYGDRLITLSMSMRTQRALSVQL